MTALVPVGSYLLGSYNVWSIGGDGQTLTGLLGDVAGNSTASTELRVRTPLLDYGSSYSTNFAIVTTVGGYVDTNPADNGYVDSVVVGSNLTPTPTVTSTPTITPTLRPGETPQPTATQTPTLTPTPTQRPMPTSVPVAYDIPSVLSNNNGSVVVVVPPGSVTSSGILVYTPEQNPTPTPTATPAQDGIRRSGNGYRWLQSFNLSLEYSPTSARRARATLDTAFTTPVIMTISYDDALLGGANPAALTIAYRGSDGSLVILPGTVDPTTRTVSAAVMSTGSYSLVIKSLSYQTLIPLSLQATTAGR
jgi:hypothetical protein